MTEFLFATSESWTPLRHAPKNTNANYKCYFYVSSIVRISRKSMGHYHLSTRCDGSTFFAVGASPFGISLSKKFELSVLTRSIFQIDVRVFVRFVMFIVVMQLLFYIYLEMNQYASTCGLSLVIQITLLYSHSLVFFYSYMHTHIRAHKHSLSFAPHACITLLLESIGGLLNTAPFLKMSEDQGSWLFCYLPSNLNWSRIHDND